MDKSEQVTRYLRILSQIGGTLFIPTDEQEILPMGEEYRLAMSRLLAKRDEMSKTIRCDLSKLSPEQLSQSFDSEGKPLSDDGKQFIAKYIRQVETTFGRLKPWYSTPLFHTKQLADFEHWTKCEFLSLDEIVWLSVGLEPDENFIAAIKQYNARGDTQKLDEVSTYMSRHREVIRRRFDPYNQRNKPKFKELLSWICEIKLNVHPRFYELVHQRANASTEKPVPDLSNESESGFDGREKASMAKLIAAMAIDGYGFDPTAKRSDIPKEIQGIADRLGLGLTTNTIRKYLRDGSAMLPEDWKPE